MSYPYRPQFFMKHPKYEPPLNEEEAQVDPRGKLEPECLKSCSKYVDKYDKCVDRALAAPEKKLQCLGQHYDLRHCVDTCVAKDLFRFLK